MTAPYTLPDVETSAPPPRKPPTGARALAGLFGDEDPQRAALIEGGLTLASHRGPGALLAAFGAGKQAYAEAEQRAREEQAMQVRQQVQELLLQSGEDPESLLSTARQALASGDFDSAMAILDIAKAQAALASELKTEVVTNQKTGESKLINKLTGATIADIYGPAEGLDDPEVFEKTMKLLDSFKGEANTLGFSMDAVFIQQLRDMTPSAKAGSSEAQEAFLRALFRLQNPGLRRVNDADVMAQADQQGLFSGKLRDDWIAITQGRFNPERISAWLEEANKAIKGRIQQFDNLRNHYRDIAGESGVNPNRATIDFMFNERAPLIPGADPEAVRVWRGIRDRRGN